MSDTTDTDDPGDADRPDRQPQHARRPATQRWTHLALRVSDIEATIAWYLEFTELELLDRREDDAGYGAWLGHPDAGEFPFVLVLAQFHAATDPFRPEPIARLAPFNHIGIEVPTREEVDEVAARAEATGCLAMPAQWMPPPIGYICMLEDPDGNLVEFSYDQGVYERVREVWG
jgi:catechol 2,3-dioxygenase-like lactoylglutathione lyase family enzyme